MLPVTAQPLTDDQLRKIAPSVFAESAHQSRSKRYAYIPTASIVTRMRAEGFAPTKVIAARVRDDDRAGFGKHMIRFRRIDAGAVRVGDVFPEVILVNSHDGTSSYQLTAGLFRLACLNGLAFAEDGAQELRVQHSGTRIADDVIEASYKVLDRATLGIEAADRWGRIQLGRDEQLALASGARQLRFGAADGTVDTPVTAEQLLQPRRSADRADDLWTTFNRVQENVVKGGLRTRAPDDRGRLVARTTREVKAIDGNLNLNKGLWIMAEMLAKSKGQPAASN